MHRERQEREAEREGRPVPEEEPDDETILSPFQPISNVISEVDADHAHSQAYC